MKKTLLLALCLSTSFFHAGGQNQNISGGLFFEGEPFLAVNPDNPRHLVVAWMGFVAGQPITLKSKVSFDGGSTWSATAILPHFKAGWQSADPSIVFDPAGNVVVCYVDYQPNPAEGAVFIVKSTDGGLTWTESHKAIDGSADGDKLPADRPWLAVDRSGGPYNGNLYLTTKPAPWVPAPNRPYFVRSEDGGVSWTPFRYVDTTGFLTGIFIQGPMAVPAVGASGDLHIIYPSWVLAQNFLPGFYLASSTDGGHSFDYRDVYFGTSSSGDTLAKAGYRFFADPADADHLAFVFTYKITGDLDVYLIETTDGGDTWTPPLRVNDDPVGNGKMQDLVWGDFDDDGDLLLAWRDRRNAEGTGYQTSTEIWGAVRWKDSTGFSANFPVSDTPAPYNFILAEAGNDFMTVRMEQDTLLAVWGDVRNGRLNIWFERKALRDDSPTATRQLTSEELPAIRLYPNPATHQVTVEGAGIREIAVFDLKGRELIRQKATVVDLAGLAPGIYSILAVTELGNVAGRVVKK